VTGWVGVTTGSFKVIGIDSVRQITYDILLAFRSKCKHTQWYISEIQPDVGRKLPILPNRAVFSTIIEGDPVAISSNALATENHSP